MSRFGREQQSTSEIHPTGHEVEYADDLVPFGQLNTVVQSLMSKDAWGSLSDSQKSNVLFNANCPAGGNRTRPYSD